MTGALWLAAGSALWLGLLTSVSPCPLATNVAAVSYLGRLVGRPRAVLAAGLLYTAGRIASYVALGAVAVWGLGSLVGVSAFLQGTLHQLLGPLLILVGMVLVGLLRLPTIGGGVSDGLVRRVDRAGLWGAAPLGAAFALSFCPVSAALFFGSLIPLAVGHRSPLLLPTLYGLGTGVPVALVAVLIAVGAGALGSALDRMQAVERWARPATGVVFILVGIWETLRGALGVV